MPGDHLAQSRLQAVICRVLKRHRLLQTVLPRCYTFALLSTGNPLRSYLRAASAQRQPVSASVARNHGQSTSHYRLQSIPLKCSLRYVMIPGDAVETQRRRTDTIFSHAFYTRRKIPMCQEVASSMSAFSLATVLDLLDNEIIFL